MSCMNGSPRSRRAFNSCGVLTKMSIPKRRLENSLSTVIAFLIERFRFRIITNKSISLSNVGSPYAYEPNKIIFSGCMFSTMRFVMARNNSRDTSVSPRKFSMILSESRFIFPPSSFIPCHCTRSARYSIKSILLTMPVTLSSSHTTATLP